MAEEKTYLEISRTKDTTPAKVQVVVDFESSGIFAIKNIELLKAPVKVQA